MTRNKKTDRGSGEGKNSMIVLGITGGIGSGKSAVLQLLSEQPDSVVLEADSLAHRLMSPGHTAYRRIVETFGREILAEDGTIDRQKMGQMVFQDPERLEQLNRIVHPEVKKSIRGRIRRAKEGGVRLFVIEAALLIQDGYRNICHEIWYIHTDREIRIRRLLKSRGRTLAHWESVLANQPEEEFFFRNTDDVIENSGTEAQLAEHLNESLNRLLLKSQTNDDIIS